MAAQIDKVLDAERNGKATIQIIPFEVGANPAQDSNFVLLEFEEQANLPPMVFVEGLRGNQYMQRKVDVDRYRETIEYLRDSALSPRDSVKFAGEMREKLITK